MTVHPVGVARIDRPEVIVPGKTYSVAVSPDSRAMIGSWLSTTHIP